MDYEQKYKKVLARAREAKKETESAVTIGILEDIFPELRESENERIRKMLIDSFARADMGGEIYGKGVTYKQVIAWLEKQGTPNQVSIWKHWKDGIAGNGEGKPIYLVKIGNTYSLTSCLGFECDYIELSELDNLMLVKQGEQNPYSGVSFSYNGNIWGMCARDNGVDILFNKKLIQHICGEKQDEQKPIIEMKSPEESLGVSSKEYSKIVNDCLYSEQKPADKVEPLDEFAGLTDFERTLADICIGWIGKEPGWKQYIKDNADVLLKIAVKKFNSVQDVSFEQKPAEWSEDYTERMGQIINYLTCQAKEEPTRKGTLLGWVALLKSIFRKGLPEIQIPCTEAARKGIHRIMDVLDWAADKGRISDSDCEDYMILLSAYLPQPKPTWSKEDKRMMDLIISVFEVNHPKGIFKDGLRAVHTDEIVSWLKSIEDRMKGE